MTVTETQTLLLSEPDIRRLVGATRRQLDVWTRRRLVVPAKPSYGSGWPGHRWSAEQVPTLMLVCRLRSLGATEAHIREVLDAVGPPTSWPYSTRTFWIAGRVGFIVDLFSIRRDARDAIERFEAAS